MAVVVGIFRRLAVIEVDQRLGLDGLLHHGSHGEIAKRFHVDLAVGQKRERAILIPGLARIRRARRVADIGVDDGRHLAADLVRIAMTAADPSAAAIVADALVPVGMRRQPDLDADTFGIGARVLVLFRRGAGADQQLHQAQIGRRRHRLRRIGRLQLLALLHQPNRDDRRVGVGAKGRLDAVIAGKRIGQRRRQITAGGQQQRRARCSFLFMIDIVFTSLFSLLVFVPNSQALGMVSGRDSRVWAASLIAALAAPKP